jgi:multicomponent Na+:H+ antiporter subunit A
MTLMLMTLLALLALTGPLLWLLRPHRWRHSGWLAALPPALVTGWLLTQLQPIAQGASVQESYAWSEAFGLTLALRLDGLALFFGLIITGIGAAIAIYTGYYFDDDPGQGRFYGLLFLFMTSMLGLVWADNLLALFIFWEGTSITSYLLISFKLSDTSALEGARRALIVTSLGGLAMLAGFVLLAQIADSYTVSEILVLPPTILTSHALYPTALILILLGAFTKSAQFPFHFWLPGAMAAPTPASAYLHSATMVKAGVYLLARLHPALSGSSLWFWSLLIAGGITMLLGAISALRYYDLKALLAYATVSQLGILVMVLAFAEKYAYIAAVVGILAHAFYKGPLFLLAGIIDHATGTRDLRRLAGLGRALPWVTATALLAALSMAGIPPTFGFLSKETLLETFTGAAESGRLALGYGGLAAAAVAGAFFVAYSLTLLWEPFFRPQAPLEPAHVHHAPALPFVLPALGLTLVGFAIPFLLSQIEGVLFAPAAGSIAGEPVEVHLALWHGLTLPFLTSMAALAAGVGLFLGREWLRAAFAATPPWLNGRAIFDQMINGIYGLAGWSTRLVQQSSLPAQISITLLCAVAFLLYALSVTEFWASLRVDWRAAPTVYEIILAALAIVAALATVRTQNRLSAIISLGVVGVVVTLIFVFFSAPDLALTQLLIEVLTVVLLVFVFYRIPPHPLPPQAAWVKVRNLLVAAAVGLWGFAMALVGAGVPLQPSISPYFSQNAVPAAHGGNIVNVILVDFRGFDTLGEITVLAIAAIGGYALLRASRLRPLQGVKPKRVQVDGSLADPPTPPVAQLPPVPVKEDLTHA